MRGIIPTICEGAHPNQHDRRVHETQTISIFCGEYAPDKYEERGQAAKDERAVLCHAITIQMS